MEKVFIALAAALAVGLSAVATAWAQSKIGTAGAGALAEKPELSGTIIILVAIPETMVILGFVVGGINPQHVTEAPVGSEELLAALRSEGEKKAGLIRQEAEAEAARLKNEAAASLGRLRNELQQEQARTIAAAESAILAEAERAARRTRLAAAEKLAEKLYQLARGLLPRLREKSIPGYSAFLPRNFPPSSGRHCGSTRRMLALPLLSFPRGAHRAGHRRLRRHGSGGGGRADPDHQYPGKTPGTGVAGTAPRPSSRRPNNACTDGAPEPAGIRRLSGRVPSGKAQRTPGKAGAASGSRKPLPPGRRMRTPGTRCAASFAGSIAR